MLYIKYLFQYMIAFMNQSTRWVLTKWMGASNRMSGKNGFSFKETNQESVIPLLLAFFPKVSLSDLHAVCVAVSPPLLTIECLNQSL